MFHRADFHVACLTLAIAWLAGGCQSFSPQGPVPKSVAACRQYSQQGINAMERGEWSRAESLLAQAVHACPVDAEARRNYAETLWHRGAANEAVTQLEEARRAATEDTALAVRTGEAYLLMGRFADARRLAEHALELDPKSAAAWALRGRTLESSGQTREALADYQRSLGYSPNNADVLLKVAEAYRQLRQPERALTVLQSLADTYPPGEEPQQVLYLEGLALTALLRYGEAAEALAMAAQRSRPTAEVLCRLAEAELLNGRAAEAHLAVAQALALEPNHGGSRALEERMNVALANRPDAVQR